MTRRVGQIDGVVFGIRIAIERLPARRKASKGVALQEAAQQRITVSRPQVDQPGVGVNQLSGKAQAGNAAAARMAQRAKCVVAAAKGDGAIISLKSLIGYMFQSRITYGC